MNNVGTLGALVAAAEQQDDALASDGVVHAVAWPDIDTQLPDAITAELVVAEVALFNACHTPDDCDLGLVIAQMLQPVKV